jgi:hypothetical protein
MIESIMILGKDLCAVRIRLWILVGSLFYSLLFICAAHAQISAQLSADPEAYSGACPADIKFKGTITSEKPGKVQFTFIRSDGVLQSVETLDFSAPGTKEVNAVWTAGVHKSQRYEGWEAIKIVYPEALESNKSAFKLVCDQTTPDLTVRIRHCPRSVKQGYELGSLVKVVAINRGEVPVKDVDLDIVLKKENTCPVPTPVSTYSAHFSNGILLKGGHEQVSLNAGQNLEITLTGANTIPTDTPAGEYFLCAVIDAGDKIKESNEANNCACCPVKVITSIAKPDLIIGKLAFKGWGKCEPNMPIFTFEVTVNNIGTATSPAMPDKPIVHVMDLHGNNWGNSAGLNAIPPGGEQAVVIPVYYFSEDPAHMTKVVPHPFRAIVDPHHLIDESNESNNKSDIIYLDPSLICPKDN